MDVFVHATEDHLDLLVEFGAVGDHEKVAAGHVLADPCREPHHREALAAPPGVPDDPAVGRLRRLHPEVLVVAADLLDAVSYTHLTLPTKRIV